MKRDLRMLMVRSDLCLPHTISLLTGHKHLCWLVNFYKKTNRGTIIKILSLCGPETGLNIELQSSRSVHPNRNDEPDLMAATRASGACLGIELILSKIHQKNKTQRAAGGSEGGSPAPRAGRPPRAPEAGAAPSLFQAARYPSSSLPGVVY